MGYYIAFASQDCVGLGNVIFRPVVITSLLPPCNEEKNSYLYFLIKVWGSVYTISIVPGFRT